MKRTKAALAIFAAVFAIGIVASPCCAFADSVDQGEGITVLSNNATDYEPESVAGFTTEVGQMPDPEKLIANFDSLPAGTKCEWDKNAMPDVSTPGATGGGILVYYPDSSQDYAKVSFSVIDAKTDADNYEPIAGSIVTNIGEMPNAADGITNVNELPKGTAIEWNLGGEPDVSTPGPKTGTALVTYPDKSTDMIEINVSVIGSELDADKYDPTGVMVTTTVGQMPDPADCISNKSELPEGTWFAWKAGFEPDVSEAGIVSGTLYAFYPDKSADEVKVDVTVIAAAKDDPAPEKNDSSADSPAEKKAADSSLPKTGDTTSPMLFLLAGFAAALAAGLLVWRKVRN